MPELGIRLLDIHWIDLWNTDGFAKARWFLTSAIGLNHSA